MVVAVIWGEKLATLAAGSAFIVVGLVLFRFGAPVVAFLNTIYAPLPGRWKYPDHYHRIVGAVAIFFGALIAVGGAIFAGQSS